METGRFCNPNGVVSRFRDRAATPLGLFAFGHVSQGSSFLATPGFWPESLWDSFLQFPKRISTQLHSPVSIADAAPDEGRIVRPPFVRRRIPVLRLPEPLGVAIQEGELRAAAVQVRVDEIRRADAGNVL